jgi:hypothetical protein
MSLKVTRQGEVETSQTTLAQLQRACERTFKAYMKACRDGRVLLAAVTDLPLSDAAQTALLLQRRKEADAHTAYTGARTKLWKFLTSKPAPPREGPASEPLEPDPSSNLSA